MVDGPGDLARSGEHGLGLASTEAAHGAPLGCRVRRSPSSPSLVVVGLGAGKGPRLLCYLGTPSSARESNVFLLVICTGGFLTGWSRFGRRWGANLGLGASEANALVTELLQRLLS